MKAQEFVIVLLENRPDTGNAVLRTKAEAIAKIVEALSAKMDEKTDFSIVMAHRRLDTDA